jgi:hypothetical protein
MRPGGGARTGAKVRARATPAPPMALSLLSPRSNSFDRLCTPPPASTGRIMHTPSLLSAVRRAELTGPGLGAPPPFDRRACFPAPRRRTIEGIFSLSNPHLLIGPFRALRAADGLFCWPMHFLSGFHCIAISFVQKSYPFSRFSFGLHQEVVKSALPGTRPGRSRLYTSCSRHSAQSHHGIPAAYLNQSRKGKVTAI